MGLRVPILRSSMAERSPLIQTITDEWGEGYKPFAAKLTYDALFIATEGKHLSTIVLRIQVLLDRKAF